jgi:hypothetical protein
MKRLDTENDFPKTPYEALHLCRSIIKRAKSESAPSKQLEFGSVMVALFGDNKELDGLVQYGFVYSRQLNQYFLFVDHGPAYYDRQFCPMHIFLIKENQLEWIGKYNTLIKAPVYCPPSTDNFPCNTEKWDFFNYGLHRFGFVSEEHTVDGLMKSMDASWNAFVMDHSIKTSE